VRARTDLENDQADPGISDPIDQIPTIPRNLEGRSLLWQFAFLGPLGEPGKLSQSFRPHAAAKRPLTSGPSLAVVRLGPYHPGGGQPSANGISDFKESLLCWRDLPYPRNFPTDARARRWEVLFPGTFNRGFSKKVAPFISCSSWNKIETLRACKPIIPSGAGAMCL